MNPIILRNKALPEIRKFFTENFITEVITPLAVKSGGIEPYIDPISLGNGLFLPTSPEISLKKQFFLLTETDKGLYEIAHAFRDDHESNFHLREFTMVEWYIKNTNYLDLSDQVLNILGRISRLNPDSGIKINECRIISIAELLHKEFGVYAESKWTLEDYLVLAEKIDFKTSIKNYTDEFLKASELIELFTLLYDKALGNFQKSSGGLVFIKDFPAFLRGMAKISEEGWAMRLEAVYNGFELCSGYQEEDDSRELLKIWQENNRVRQSMNKPPHPVDDQLLEISYKMKGVSGMALGLERSIMAIHRIDNIRNFKIDPFN